MMRLPMAVALLMTACGVVSAAEPDLTCAVRTATQPAPGAQFRPGAANQTLDGGFSATATTKDVTDGRRLDVVVRDTTGGERQIVLDCTVRLAGDFTHAFVTDGVGPRPLGEKGSTVYRGSCSLPALTVYGERTGVTVAAPFEVQAPALTFSWTKTDAGVDITASVTSRRLPAGGEATAGLLVGEHEGCWRPGLGWLVHLYPAYFAPPNPKVYDSDGPMVYDFVTTQERLRRDLTQDLSWQELGWYWPHLGLYLPPGESWQRQPRTEGGLGEGGPVSRQMLNDFIHLAKGLGIAECLYFQSTESWAEYAATNFPESRIQHADGSFAPTWIKCVVMDPDPRGRFGQHILGQITKLMDAFPEMSGVFWDQNCYTGFDFAHDDGVSMVNGRRVSMMEFPQERMLEQGGKLLHDRGKVIFTNGGWTAGLARYCDGHMSEGSGPTRRLQYLCMSKHLTLLSYDSSPRAAREKLLLALETGAQPAVTLGNDACRAMYVGYQPIFRHLRRKSWVFSPRALDLPDGFRGNIFRTAEGNYLITLAPDAARSPSLVERDRSALARVRLADLKGTWGVYAYDPDVQGLQAVAASRNVPGARELSVRRLEHGGAILLARSGRYVASGTPFLLAGQPQSISVDLANLTDAPWEGAWEFRVGEQTLRKRLKLRAHDRTQVALGTLPVGEAGTPLTIHVTCPPGSSPGETTVQIPVVAPLAVQVSGSTVSVLKGGEVEYALSNRTTTALPVSVQLTWEGGQTETRRVELPPGDAVRYTASPALAPGLHEVTIVAQSRYGRVAQALPVDVLQATLPRDFRVEQATGLTLSLDTFNSLGGQWADKPVQVNGVAAGPLPLTGSTLKWHKGLTMRVDATAARAMLQAGLRDNGDLELKVTVGNSVKNCFKLRNLQATIETAGGRILSTTSRQVYCSDPGWLYTEGECVRMGTPVPAGTVRFIREP
ncbi:hypothetical protein LLH23_17375 [bacterium]|nr:hypothetical protein [bacterium]